MYNFKESMSYILYYKIQTNNDNITDNISSLFYIKKFHICIKEKAI